MGPTQRVTIEEWTKPTVTQITENVIVGYNDVNPREEDYTYTESVSAGFETRTREIQVFDHYETVMVEQQQPVYVEDTRTVSVPVYRDEVQTQDVPIYRDEIRTRTETQTVWVDASGDPGGGTAVAGTGSSSGYWAEQEVTVEYTEQVIDHYESQEVTVQVLDHYEDQTETYQRLDHYETVMVEQTNEVYRTETEEYQEEIFEEVERQGTRTVYDKSRSTRSKRATN